MPKPPSNDSRDQAKPAYALEIKKHTDFVYVIILIIFILATYKLYSFFFANTYMQGQDQGSLDRFLHTYTFEYTCLWRTVYGAAIECVLFQFLQYNYPTLLYR